MTLRPDSARAVAVALSDAIGDVLAERDVGFSPRLFVDAAVAIRLILGFRDHAHWSEDAEFATTLLALGRMGELAVLPPHSLEVANKIQSYLRGAEEDIAALSTFLHEHGAAELAAELDAMSIERATRFVRERGRQAFVALERGSGTTAERFRRMPLCFVADDGGLKAIASGEVTTNVFSTLNQIRPGAVDQNRTDAMCWAWLSWIASRTFNRRARSVIFFTTDQHFRRAMCESPIATLRSADEFYILSRATLPGLGIRELSTAPDSNGGDIQDVKSVHAVLSAWVKDNLPVSSLSGVHTPWGNNLVDVIYGLHELYFVQGRWQRWTDIPKAVVKVLPQLEREPRHGEFRNEVAKELANAIDRKRRDLERSVQSVKKLVQLIARMRDQVNDRRTKVTGDMYIDPMKDLGLVRWGVLLEEERQDEVTRNIQALIGTDRILAEEALTRIAAMVGSADRPNECLEVAAYLWFLAMFDDLLLVLERQLGRRVPSDDDVLLLSLRTMRLAARQHVPPPPEDVDSVLAEISDLRDQLDEVVKGRESAGAGYLGLGYAAYMAWRHVTEMNTNIYGTDISLSNLAAMAYSCGLKAATSIPMGTLAWAFAVNHCAYVGTRIGRSADDVEHWIAQLERIQGQYPHLWHYRFVDTLAYWYFAKGKALWEAAGKPSGANAQNHADYRRWCFQMSRARELWQSMNRDLGEGEIRQHRLESDRLWARAECVGVAS
ncbi:MAG TPA: hypothetical protein VFK05_18485 [Polyangiaceae bacterium]|nr:hypothetical protein [Polyangiaceae bacterium]